MIENFQCDICDRTHDVVYGLESPIPDILASMPKAEQKQRVENLKEFYLVDKKRLFVNGNIFIYSQNKDEVIFTWTVWASISAKDFQNKIEELRKGKTIIFVGKLENELPFFKKSKDLRVNVMVNVNYEEAVIKLVEDCELKKLQHGGISDTQMIDVMQRLYHHTISQKEEVLNTDFDDLWNEQLVLAWKQLEKDKNMVVNISSHNTVLFQLVTNQILEEPIEGIGMGIHLPFDDSFSEHIEQEDTFKGKNYAQRFKFYDLDGINTYQIDLGSDTDELKKLVKNIIKDVYQTDLKKVEIDNFEV